MVFQKKTAGDQIKQLEAVCRLNLEHWVLTWLYAYPYREGVF